MFLNFVETAYSLHFCFNLLMTTISEHMYRTPITGITEAKSDLIETKIETKSPISFFNYSSLIFFSF